jgi:hypothetical protein
MHPSRTRRHLMSLALLGLVPGLGRAAGPAHPSITTSLQFDAVYIPALFLTGSAAKTPDGPAKAVAAMKRLSGQWLVLKPAMIAAVPDRRTWPQALQAAEGHLREADALVAKAQWEPSHEALEHVRDVLFEARRSLGIDYALDEFTAYHVIMERLAGATRVQRPVLEADFAAARAGWRRVEAMSFDAAAYGLSPARARQLDEARADESRALSALSEALRAGSDADVLKAAAAIKPPFVRAYVAFGAPL